MSALYRFILLLSLFITTNVFAQRVKKIHFKSILIDTHNDIPETALAKGLSFDQSLKGKTHSDLKRMAEGGVDAQFFSIWCDGQEKSPYALANRQMDTVMAWTNRNPDKMVQAFTAEDIIRIAKQKKLAVLFGVEGGHMIENDLNKLDALYKRGARYMTLTWNNSTPWASSAMEETNGKIPEGKKGLSPFGRDVVKRMNQLGMMVDLSHVGEQTFKDAMATTTKPVIVSHSCVWNLAHVFRNLKDDQIDAVGKNGGVICINFFSGFLDSNFMKRQKVFFEAHQPEKDSLLKTGMQQFFVEDYLFQKYPAEVDGMRATLNTLMDHIDYIVKRIGADHVGLGSDFDGINSAPRELNGIEDFPKITEALQARGYSNKDIKKILGGNVARVFGENQK